MKKRNMKKPTDCSAPVVKLAVNNPVCSHDELAAIDFQPVATFVGLPNDLSKLERHESFLRSIAIISRVAVSMLGLSKAEVVENIRKGGDQEHDVEMLEWLADGRKSATELLDMITRAECRYACAMASVYNEDGSLRDPAA
jgi:hypothetical protein